MMGVVVGWRVLPFRSSKIAVVEGRRVVGQLGFWVQVCLFLVGMVSGSPTSLKGMRADLSRSFCFCLYLRDSIGFGTMNFYRFGQTAWNSVDCRHIIVSGAWVNFYRFTDLWRGQLGKVGAKSLCYSLFVIIYARLPHCWLICSYHNNCQCTVVYLSSTYYSDELAQQ